MQPFRQDGAGRSARPSGHASCRPVIEERSGRRDVRRPPKAAQALSECARVVVVLHNLELPSVVEASTHDAVGLSNVLVSAPALVIVVDEEDAAVTRKRLVDESPE